MPAKKKPAPKKRAPAVDRRHERFVLEYLKDFNGAAAYQRAGYEVKDGAVARAAAARLLADVSVSRMVKEAVAKLHGDIEADAARLLVEAKRIAFADLASYFWTDEDGKHHLKPFDALSPAQRAALASVEIEGDKVKIKLCDKNAAHERLFKHEGLFEKDNQQRADVLRAFYDSVKDSSRGLPSEQPKV